jgi:hypothetical protein
MKVNISKYGAVEVCSDTGLIKLNDILEVGNKIRLAKELSVKSLDIFLRSINTELNSIKLIDGEVWADYRLALKFAEWVDVVLEYYIWDNIANGEIKEILNRVKDTLRD